MFWYKGENNLFLKETISSALKAEFSQAHLTLKMQV
jgi:hypothetical protein